MKNEHEKKAMYNWIISIKKAQMTEAKQTKKFSENANIENSFDCTPSKHSGGVLLPSVDQETCAKRRYVIRHVKSLSDTCKWRSKHSWPFSSF